MNKIKLIASISVLVAVFLAQTPLNAKTYKGAEYRTKESYTYGRFEVRMKSFEKEGMLASFFTYHDNDVASNWNEIDLEIMGRYSNNVQFNTITPGQVNHVRANYVPFNPSLDFHTYAFEWTPGYVSWFIDGKEVYRQTGSHIQSLNKAQKIMMNVWCPAYAGWAGAFSPAFLPAFAFYDFVSYYSYTPGSGSYGSGNNFTLKWKDDFNSWDQSRWEKATHTWDGNNCDFITDNAVIKDGMLTLCLTDSYHTGYTDKAMPQPMWARAEGSEIKIKFSEEIDKAAAEAASNYTLQGVTVKSASLLSDRKTVELTLEGYNPAVQSTITVSNIKDSAPEGNTLLSKTLSLIKQTPLSFPIKINAGGGTAQNGFLADQEWKESSEYGYQDGGVDAAPYGPAEVYKNALKGMVSYKVRVPEGKYNVKLMLMENYFTQAGRRIFDVFVENQDSSLNLDLYSLSGINKAYEKIFSNVSVTDGVLDIYFSARVDMAQLYGIVIEKASTGVEETKNDEKASAGGAESFSLGQNYPNPFNGMTRISFTLAHKDNIVFNVYDLLGNLVFREELGLMQKGKNNYLWKAVHMNGKPLSSGVYLYSVQGNGYALYKKMILLN
ncbi:MAG TPA: family 16 glycosylhydrolase [Ignavibacteriales bacterium]|nr:family 16 glycosylhydrolase [Ignavibacteriales bacterium]